MIRYVAKRLLAMIPLVFCVVFLVFSIINAIPGDPGRNILGLSANQEEVDAFNAKLGLDKPFIIRFFNYLSGIVTRFDFGASYYSGQSVTQEIGTNFAYTFRLTMLGVALYVAIGIPLGVMSAVKQYSAADNIARVMAMFICYESD
jgi:peptide/nickel transport system permease protein